MDSIVKIFTGRYIDLSKIVSISDAHFIDRMGSGGYFVGFEIHFQLLENPILYEREVECDEYNYSEGKVGTLGKSSKLLAEYRLQQQIDEVVAQWKQFKGE